MAPDRVLLLVRSQGLRSKRRYLHRPPRPVDERSLAMNNNTPFVIRTVVDKQCATAVGTFVVVTAADLHEHEAHVRQEVEQCAQSGDNGSTSGRSWQR